MSFVLAAAVVLLALLLAFTRRALARERAARAHVERLALVGRMSAGFAHDLRNSVMVLQGFGDLARKSSDQPTTDPKLAGLVREVSDQSRRIGAELQSYLRLAAGDPAKDALVPLAAVLESAVALVKPLAREKERTLELDPSEAAPLDVREIATRAALLNLLLNAIDHATAAVQVRVTPTPGAIVIAIEDDGPGVSAELASRLFEPFSTGRAGGTGLGLSGTRDALEAQGATISHERVGSLTRFVVRFPVS